MSAHLIYHSSTARSRCFRHFFIPIAPQGGRRGSKENRRRRTRSASLPSAARAPRPLRRRKAQHLSRRWTFPPFCTTMIFAREDIPPPRTHAPVAQLDRVSDSDSEGHRFDSCRVYHNSRRTPRREFLLSRAGVLPLADAVCAAAALFSAPHPVDPRHGNKLPRTSFTFTAQPRYSVLAPLRPYDSCRVYHTGIIRTRNKIRCSYYSLQRTFSALFR